MANSISFKTFSRIIFLRKISTTTVVLEGLVLLISYLINGKFVKYSDIMLPLTALQNFLLDQNFL